MLNLLKLMEVSVVVGLEKVLFLQRINKESIENLVLQQIASVHNLSQFSACRLLFLMKPYSVYLQVKVSIPNRT